MRFKILIAVVLLNAAALYCQTDKVGVYLQMITQGKLDEVKYRLPDLLADYPDDPGVLLLHGVVLDDASKAIELYKRVVKEYPKSQWADDALWRIVQYYSIIGDTMQAQSELKKFRTLYPASEFLAPAVDIVNTSLGIVRSGISRSPKKSLAPAKQNEDKIIAEPEVSNNNANQAGNEISEEKAAANDIMPDENVEESGAIILEKENSISSEAAPTSKGPKRFCLQIGIFSKKETAHAEKRKFVQMRMNAEILEKTVKGETMFAVTIGNYSSRESAEASRPIVEQHCGCKPIILEK